jgi:hypothetical protein
MGYKTKSMIYAKSLKANLNLTGEEKSNVSVSGQTLNEGKEALTKARKQAEDEAEKRSNSWITEGALGKNTKTQDNFFDGTGAKALPERENELIKTGSKKTKEKETGAYSAGTKLLDKTGKKVGQDAGVLSGLASGSAGTQAGTAIGIMVNKMDKSPRSTAKFDSKIKKAQGRGNLAKAARLEKREAGYAYRQEKRATRIDPTYKGKTDNTKAEKLKAGKIRRGDEVKPISTKLTKKQESTTSMNQITSQNVIPLNINKDQYKVKASTKRSTTGTKGSTTGTKRSTTGTKGSTKVGKNTVLRNPEVGKNTVLRDDKPLTYKEKMNSYSKYKGIGTGTGKGLTKSSKPKTVKSNNSVASSINNFPKTIKGSAKKGLGVVGKYLLGLPSIK